MISKDELIDSFFTRHVVDESLVRSELHGIWESGYQEGLRDNEEKINEEGTRQYNKGYANGHDAGKDEAYKELSGWTTQAGNAKWMEAYRSGKNLAWGIAQKLMAEPRKGGYSLTDMYNIFGTDKNESVLLDHTVDEVIGMIDAFHAKKKFAPTNWDKFREDFSFITGEILHTSLNGVRGFFVTDDWANRAYEEPKE